MYISMDIIGKYFLALFFMLFFLMIWFMVQKLSRKVAAELPEFGKAREEGGGCGGGKCNCSSSKQCINKKISKSEVLNRL